MGRERIRCACCRRHRNLMAMSAISFGDRTLLVCEDRHGCLNLYMPIRRAGGT